MNQLLTLSTILIFSSYAFHSGTTTNNLPNEPVVYKDRVVGIASTNVVLGIGGLSKDALIPEARMNMVKARPLEGAEQYSNVDVNVKRTYYEVGLKTKVTVSADVIQPKDSINQSNYSGEYFEKISASQSPQELFDVGDLVFIYNVNDDRGQIIRFVGPDRVEVKYTDTKGDVRTTETSINRIYVSMPEHRGLTLNQRTYEGIVIGFGIKRALVKASGGYDFTIKQPK